MLSVAVTLAPDVPYVPLLFPSLGGQHRESILFLNNAFRGLTEPLVRIVDNPEDADILLLPHNYPAVRNRPDILEPLEALSRRLGKRVLVFWHGDSDGPVALTNAIVLRTSQYRLALRSNEILMPAYTDDLLAGEALSFRPKGIAPVVGFCGWAEYKNLKNRLGTYSRNALICAKSLATSNPQYLARRKGLSFRREVLSALAAQEGVQTNFIIRSSYSGHQSTIGLDPEQARREYRENILGSDLALAVKGDGNYSYRFFEALSLGRVPLLLDTDCVLPLEDVIHYDDFVLRVPFPERAQIAAHVRSFWASLAPERFTQMQRAARDAFDRYLKPESFLAYAMNTLIPKTLAEDEAC